MTDPVYNKTRRRYEYDCPVPGCTFSTSSPANRKDESILVIQFHESHIHKARKARNNDR